MAVLVTILNAIAAIPKMLEMLERLSDALIVVIDRRREKQATEELAKAIEKSKLTKDASEIEDFFNPKP